MSVRFILSLAVLMFVVSFLEGTSSGAPISGNLTLDIVVTPDCNTLTYRGPSSLNCSKVDGTYIKIETDLILTLSISGLDVTTTSTFTLKGLETEIIGVVGTIGALTVRTTLVFAMSVTEIGIVRTDDTLSLRYCVAYHTPGDITPPFFDCPTADHDLFYLIEDVGVYHPIVQNLGLAFAYDDAGALDGSLYFVKKVVELNINIAGLVLGVRSLFAHIGTAQDPAFATGIILSLEGQTISGVTVRAETWFGARQGLECFAECKPNQRVYGGHVVDDFSIQEEKLFIRNLIVAGVSHSLRAEFQFFTQPGDAGPGLTYLEWSQRALVHSLNIFVSNTIRLNQAFAPQIAILEARYHLGDFTTRAIFYVYQSSTNTWEAQLAQFINTLDLTNIILVSDLTLCTESLFVASCTDGTFEHNLHISAAIGNFIFNMRLILLELISGFSEAWFDLTYTLIPGVEVTNRYVVGLDALKAFSFSIVWKF